jgi:hypothetical protein
MKQATNEWPDHITVREVMIKNNPGVTDDAYPIYTTATGYGYEQHIYHSNEQFIAAADKNCKVHEALVDVVRSLVYLRLKAPDDATREAIAQIINDIPSDLG